MMGFRLGIILGLAVAAYLLLAGRAKGREALTMAELAREDFEEEERGEDEVKSRLRQALDSIGEQIEAALAEAREAAKEAEEKMQARYQETLRHGRQPRPRR